MLVNETDTDVTLSGAQIKRLSLAIMIDKSLETQKDDIEGIVKQAVGFDEQRNDTFTTAVTSRAASMDTVIPPRRRSGFPRTPIQTCQSSWSQPASWITTARN